MLRKITQKDLPKDLQKIMALGTSSGKPEVTHHINSLALNLILTTLSQSKRIEFYKHLAEEDYKSAEKLIYREIPDFKQKLQTRLEKSLASLI